MAAGRELPKGGAPASGPRAAIGHGTRLGTKRPLHQRGRPLRCVPIRPPNLVPGDTNDALDVFVHDRETGTTSRASIDSARTQASTPTAAAAAVSPTPSAETPLASGVGGRDGGSAGPLIVVGLAVLAAAAAGFLIVRRRRRTGEVPRDAGR